MATVPTMLPWILIALALANSALAKVSSNFNDCLGHFYDSTPPVGFDNVASNQPGAITPLCLMLEKHNNPFFASLYHKEKRFPLFAAYILDIRPGDDPGLNPTFRLEPQLVDTRLPEFMMPQPETESSIRKHRLPGTPVDLIKQSQAINSDYTDDDYRKGHLNPRADHPAGPGQQATYTLANVAPMYGSLNSGQWRANEIKVRNIAANKCIKMYVVTGAVPGTIWIPQNRAERRVNIPSHIWSAFCCLDIHNRPVSAEGSLAPNNANSVQSGLSIASLQSQLNSLLGVNVVLFKNNCS